MEKQVVLFIDGSEASLKAAFLAAELARSCRGYVKAFFLIDSGWGSMLGDEWINTSGTRVRFYHWFEGELEKFASSSLEEVAEAVQARGVNIETEIITGTPEKLIIDRAGEKNVACLVLPNPYATSHRAEGGLKYNINALAKKISCPLIIGPK